MVQSFKNQVHLVQAFVANVLFGFPGRHVQVIGVTGTDGKTTTTSLLYHILHTAGRNVSMISTVYAKIGDSEYDTGLHTTTPNSFFVQKMLKKSVRAGDEFFVLETTSHALDQNRVWGVPFVASLITNITHEHFDYHKTHRRYLLAKAKLLLASKFALLNRDDGSYSQLEQLLDGRQIKRKTYGLHAPADYSFDIGAKLGQTLPEFNAYNYLACYGLCRELGLTDAEIYSGMQSFVLPQGRVEELNLKGKQVIIDFAHTPNAVANLLKFVKQKYPEKNIIHVFGAAGKRDSAKRPLMGEASAAFADKVILTEEDYRTESVSLICEQIAEGLRHLGFEKNETLSGSHQFISIFDRNLAIQKAVSIMSENDIVVVTGKGHEKSLARGKNEIQWSDKEAIKQAFVDYSL
ncbi:hypothetical protein HGA88_03795 [Candidatus Roizmanbacteria bacterium]|nr:hypothetical protein [Candidatus Roizmanbacteria bacterium]